MRSRIIYLSILLLPLLFSVGVLKALEIDGYSSQVNDRFSNDASFIAQGFNISGVARTQDGQWLTMISRTAFIACNHWHPASGNTVVFYKTNDPSGEQVTRTVSSVQKRIGTTDLFLGTLNEPLPADYAYYAYATETIDTLVKWNQSAYKLASVYHVGQSPSGSPAPISFAVGRNKLDDWMNITDGVSTNAIFVATKDSVGEANFVNYESIVVTYDSGAPIFYDQGNGTLRVIGITWVLLSDPQNNPQASGFSVVGNYADVIADFLLPQNQWRYGYFNITSATGDASDSADPDGDGASNLLEYALGSNPLIASPNTLPSATTLVQGETTYLSLSVSKNPSALNVTYTIEVSTDLQVWNSGPGYTVTVSETAQQSVVRTETPLSVGTPLFMRLKIQTTP